MTKRAILALPLAAVIAIASSLPVVAQVTTGTIVGTVSDAGGVVPGATVTVREVNKGTTSTCVTDGTGNYTASFLVPGTYAVEVNVQGFKKSIREGVILQVNQHNYTSTVNRDTTDHVYSGRVDHRFSGNDSFFARFNYGKFSLDAPQGQAACCLPTPADRPRHSLWARPREFRYVTVEEVHGRGAEQHRVPVGRLQPVHRLIVPIVSCVVAPFATVFA